MTDLLRLPQEVLVHVLEGYEPSAPARFLRAKLGPLVW